MPGVRRSHIIPPPGVILASMNTMPRQGKHEVHRNLVARLKQQAADVRRLVSGLDEETLSLRTLPDKWSLKELVGHLHRVQEVFSGRLTAMLNEDNPAIASYNPDGDAEFERLCSLPADRVLAVFLENRESLLTVLEKLPIADWHRPGRHPEYSFYDIHFLIEYLTHHEAHHLYQIYQRRGALGKIPH